MWRDHLEQAERHVALGEQHIARQRELIAKLERDGHEKLVIEAKELLQKFEQTQVLHIADRDRLREELELQIKMENKTGN